MPSRQPMVTPSVMPPTLATAPSRAPCQGPMPPSAMSCFMALTRSMPPSGMHVRAKRCRGKTSRAAGDSSPAQAGLLGVDGCRLKPTCDMELTGHCGILCTAAAAWPAALLEPGRRGAPCQTCPRWLIGLGQGGNAPAIPPVQQLWPAAPRVRTMRCCSVDSGVGRITLLACACARPGPRPSAARRGASKKPTARRRAALPCLGAEEPASAERHSPRPGQSEQAGQSERRAAQRAHLKSGLPGPASRGTRAERRACLDLVGQAQAADVRQQVAQAGRRQRGQAQPRAKLVLDLLARKDLRHSVHIV